MENRVVIIGAGIAGVQAAQSLAASSDVTLINNEPFLPYYRMRIEEVVNGGKPESLFMHPASWYEEKGIRLLPGEVVSIDEKNRSVLLADGAAVPYDSLVIAAGSKANIFPLAGTRKEYFSLRTMSDAIAIGKAISVADGSAVIIGGGLLGLELASSIAGHRSIPVTVVESAASILPRQLDPDSASLLEELLREKGVSIVTGAKAKEADDRTLLLDDGRQLAADTIIFSAGVHCDFSFLHGTSVKTGRGIIVDHDLRTSALGIYAAGDAAELDGQCFGLAMYAREMGIAVASSIKDGSAGYVPSSPSSILKIGGLDVASIGELKGSRIVESGGKSRRTYFVEDGILRGAVFVGEKAPMSLKAMIGKPYEVNSDR